MFELPKNNGDDRNRNSGDQRGDFSVIFRKPVFARRLPPGRDCGSVCRPELEGPRRGLARFASHGGWHRIRPLSVSRFRRCRSLAHLGSMLVAQGAIFFQRLVDDVFQFGGHVGIQAHRGRRPESRMALKIIAEVSPRKGKVPVAISYSTAPKENRSVRASSSFPFACSGDI